MVLKERMRTNVHCVHSNMASEHEDLKYEPNNRIYDKQSVIS